MRKSSKVRENNPVLIGDPKKREIAALSYSAPTVLRVTGSNLVHLTEKNCFCWHQTSGVRGPTCRKTALVRHFHLARRMEQRFRLNLISF